jgi:hypothetical protein
MESKRIENGEQPSTHVGLFRTDLVYLVITCLVTGFLMKMPQLFAGIPESNFYEKNAGLIVLMGLSAYRFLTSKGLSVKHLIVSVVIFVVSAVYINLLPPVNLDRAATNHGDSIVLACIHLPLFLWCLYGFIFIGFDATQLSKRMDYIKYNGDIAILTALILIAGGILTGMTYALFSAIGMDISRFYADYIIVLGLVSAPIVSTYIVKHYPSVTSKLAPIIAGIFSPLVLITLLAFLISIVVTGKDPYNDREFLLVFNLMLLGVMALIVFSVSEASLNKRQRYSVWMLLALSVVSLVIDGVALSAIVYRLGEYGFTPNRTAVLGSNLLIFGNLVWVMVELLKVAFGRSAFDGVERIISRYLLAYVVWTFLVAFGFPLLFGMQ